VYFQWQLDFRLHGVTSQITTLHDVSEGLELSVQCWTLVDATRRSSCGETLIGLALTRYANSSTSTPSRRAPPHHSQGHTPWSTSGSMSLALQRHRQDIYLYLYLCGARGSVVVKALRYKPDSRGFDTR
jgi:hypothetical protein